MGRIHNKPLGILISVFSIMFAISAAVLLIKVTDSGPRPDKGAFDPYAIEGRLAGYQDKTPEQGENFQYLISASPYFKSSAADGNIMLENTPGNDYLMKVTYTLKDKNQVVYQSGFIRPGWHVQKAPLDQMLNKGIYPAIATIAVLEDITFEQVAEFKEEINIYVGKKP